MGWGVGVGWWGLGWEWGVREAVSPNIIVHDLMSRSSELTDRATTTAARMSAHQSAGCIEEMFSSRAYGRERGGSEWFALYLTSPLPPPPPPPTFDLLTMPPSDETLRQDS